MKAKIKTGKGLGMIVVSLILLTEYNSSPKTETSEIDFVCLFFYLMVGSELTRKFRHLRLRNNT